MNTARLALVAQMVLTCCSCGATCHLRKDYSFREKGCRNCQKTGRNEKACRAPISHSNVRPQRRANRVEEERYKVQHTDLSAMKFSRYLVPVLLNDAEASVEVDSGSEVTILHVDLFFVF